MNKTRKALRILLVIVFLYGVLVATHEGEFWPFSIYPMFSKAGKPWTRALVRDVTMVQQDTRWDTLSFSQLPGEEFPMNEVGINTNDLANFVQKAGEWNATRVNGIRKLFKSELDNRELMVMKVNGYLDKSNQDSITIDYIPYILIKSDTTLLNPAIKP